MKVTITVKEVNPDFDHELAEREHEGKESEDNILYTWEDEFVLNGDIRDFKIRNNADYSLAAEKNGKQLVYKIPALTLVECTDTDDQLITCAFSRSLVKDTKKVIRKNGDIHFFVFLKGGKKIASPFTGFYIAEKDFPKDLPLEEEE
jgi:hypothetical protein